MGQPHKVQLSSLARWERSRGLSAKMPWVRMGLSKDVSKCKCLLVKVQHVLHMPSLRQRPTRDQATEKVHKSVKIWITQLNSINTTTLISERTNFFSQANFFMPPKDTETLWLRPEHEASCLVPEDKDLSSWPTLGNVTPGTLMTPFKSPCDLVSKGSGSSPASLLVSCLTYIFWTENLSTVCHRHWIRECTNFQFLRKKLLPQI